MHIRELLGADLNAPWLVQRGQKDQTQSELLRAALLVATKIGVVPLAQERPLRVAIACHSFKNFAPALLGALGASATVHLLPNMQAATLERAAEGSDFLLHDADPSETGIGSERGLFLPPLLTSNTAPSVSEFREVEAARIVLSTSGTTGHPGQSIKRLQQITSETEVLLPLFAGATSVLSTVPPFHLFGLLFGLLLPLKVGARVVEHSAFFLADVADAIRTHDVDVLVSTPAHLALMLQAPMPKGIKVFSSGARLTDVLHFGLMATHDFRITDILGSTETGGMATRDLPLSRWTPLPGVVLNPSDVRSPWCDDGSQELKDAIELFPDGTFLHAGRRDNVVKVAGKRASLSAIEDLVRGLPGVSDVAIWQDRSGRKEPRLRYAVARPADAPPLSKQDIGHAVAREFDPVFTPRQVVFLVALPREATGKLPEETLAKLFSKVEVTPPLSDVALTLTRDATVSCALPANLVFFQGHFPGLPILPGAALIDRVVLPAIRLIHDDLGVVGSMQRIRFVKTVTPTQQLNIAVVRTGERVSFEVHGAGGVVATGVLVFRTSQGRG